MQYVLFGDKHSYLDYGLILTKKTIGTPEAKRYVVDVPGKDGIDDLTEIIGEVKFGNRPLKLEFEAIENQEDYNVLFSAIQNDLQGKTDKIILSIDPDFYYLGSIKINEWESDVKIGRLVVDIDAHPYKYKINETVYSGVISSNGELTANLYNLRKSVVPTFATQGEVSITFDNQTYSVNSGTVTIPNILFKKGINVITFKGASGTTITVRYQEGCL